MRIRLSRRYVIPAVVTAVLAGGGTAAYAAVAASPVSSGVINGCYTNAAIHGTHVFVLQDAGTNCPKGTTPISWNEQGPAGPSGPAGPTTTVTVTATPTTSSTLFPSPDNSCGSLTLGTLGSGESATTTGVNVGSSPAWYTVNIVVSSFTFTVTDTAVSGAPAGSDVMNVYSSCTGAAVASNVTSYTGTASGTYYVQVIEGSSGADGGFTLTASAS